ncbi:MAG: pyridoxal-dependent decarboxylase [bacterium]|nr:pyridoxal-dependent decarboxylase [bacterium]
MEVETRDFRYDLEDLERVVTAYQGRISTLIAYAGDSRSMTIDNFAAIYDIVKGIDPSIRLHADACHGFCLGCSQSLRSKIAGIELFDSITTDPHKVFNLPYVISALLLKTPSDIKKVTSISDLIMQEPFSFGQVTPFIGSKQWLSLKLRFFIKNL